MSAAVTVDPASLNSWILKFHDELGVAVDKTARYEMRLCLADCIRWSPPKSLSLGREKVARDFKRSSEPLDDSVIRGNLARSAKRGSLAMPDIPSFTLDSDADVFAFQMERANFLIQKKDYQGMNALLRNIGGKLASWTVVPFTTELFTNAPRGSGGGIASQKKFVFQRTQWRAALRKVQGHVGRLKAAWLKSYYAVGGKTVADWVDRHKDTPRGHYAPPTKSGHVVIYTAINAAAGVGKTRAIVARALKARAQAARKDFHLFLKGVKDISQIE